MPSSQYSSLMHPFTLGFRDRNLERAFVAWNLPRTLDQGRVALFIGGLIYLMMGCLDNLFVPVERQQDVWAIRLGTGWVPPFLLLLSYSRCFGRACHVLLASNGLVGGLGLVAMISVLPRESAAYYYPSLILITFYIYNFSGTRFIHAFCADLALIASYNFALGHLGGMPVHVLASQDFFIVSANLIGGAAGYMAEYQRRMLFLQKRDIEAERQLHLDRSMHDRLTGLPNRELLYDRISQALSFALREGTHNAGYFIDLDGFKQINDRFGHEVGDRVLKLVAQRLREVVREADTVSRLAGDEFFVLARGLESVGEARRLAVKMLASLSRSAPDLPDGLRLSASVGVCLFPWPGVSVAGIIDQADQAMYEAKRLGKSCYAIAGEPVDGGQGKCLSATAPGEH
ncbi:GGDEF domain-containing protein [Uliginosibacterium paludis]|uniref:GGDEF domain-containing protein n=2 Tax=Uliginosibacterium paludis TaxID=1615952 RepID=A0ABV2CQ78_9RHOO